MISRFSGLALVCAVALSNGVGRESAAADAYTVDPVHSSVVFHVRHMGTSNAWGRFNELSGGFTLDESNPAQSQLEFQVKTGSVDTGNAARDKHLKSADFFNAVQYPVISFKSKSVTKTADGYEVAGDLTLHGVTKPLQVKVVPVGTGKGPRGGAIAGIDATFTVKQSEFGMTKMVGPIGDDVWVNVSIEAGKK